MPTLTVRMRLDSDGIPPISGPPGRTTAPPLWEASTADFGYCTRNPTNNVSSPSGGGVTGADLGFYLDTGDLAVLSAAIGGSGTIDSITASVEHTIVGLAASPPAATPAAKMDILYEAVDNGALVVFAAFSPNDNVSPPTLGTYYTKTTAAATVDPIAHTAWTITKLQACVLLLELYTITNAVYHCDLFYLTVTYTPPAPTEVDVTGQGGMDLGGSATITQGRIVNGQGGVMLGRSSAGAAFGAGTGPAAELHLNQWGLEAFMLDTDLNEHLG